MFCSLELYTAGNEGGRNDYDKCFGLWLKRQTGENIVLLSAKTRALSKTDFKGTAVRDNIYGHIRPGSVVYKKRLDKFSFHY